MLVLAGMTETVLEEMVRAPLPQRSGDPRQRRFRPE